MTKQVQRRRGTATQHTSFTGAEGELSVNTTNKSVHVHDNVTAGGFEAARVDMDNVTSSSILTAAGITATTTELNYVDGVTSAIQTQIDGKAGTASPTFTGTLTTANLTATGTTTLAGASTSADITFGDNDKAIFGAGSDLSIFHNGSASIIEDSGTGGITLRSNLFTVQNAAGTETVAQFVEDGFVKLFHNNSQVFTTTSTGIDVTGTVTADGLTVDGAATIVGNTSPASDEVLLNLASLNGTGTAGNMLRFTDTDPTAINNGSIGKIQFYSEDTDAVVAEIEGQNADASPDGRLLLKTAEGTTLRNRLKISNNGDISFYEDTGTTAKFFWDASSENLGIGTSSPQSNTGIHIVGADGASGATANVAANELFVDNDGNTGVTVGTSNTGVGYYAFADSDVALRGGIFYNHTDDAMGFRVLSTEAMRLDASGNLLVGTTNASLGTGGIQLNASGRIGAAASSLSPMVLNRQTSDGTIIDLRKDGTTMGSIGNVGNNVYYSGGSNLTYSTGLLMKGASASNTRVIVPADDSGTELDTNVSLGRDVSRFKDLYLSGGVFLGGTGAANKLDDYEEGTWTPVYLGLTSNPTCTYDIQAGYYTKVGDLVTCTGRIRTDAVSGGSGVLALGGLPFNSKNVPTNGTSGTLQVGKYLAFTSGQFAPKMGFVQDNNNYCTLIYEANDNSAGNCNVAALNNTTNDNDIHFSITYVSA